MTPTGSKADANLDVRVRQFLDEHADDWQDLNVPVQDGRILHDLVVANNFHQALEIGTSTGHSTIWIAWALSKTSGKLTTVETDNRRCAQARANVAEAGLSDYVEFILGDAHAIVPALEKKFDFVFSDADKDWYIQYFDAMYPKLTSNACFVAHNVDESAFSFRRRWQAEYLAHVRKVEDMETRIHPDGRNGVAITCKKRASPQ